MQISNSSKENWILTHISSAESVELTHHLASENTLHSRGMRVKKANDGDDENGFDLGISGLSVTTAV